MSLGDFLAPFPSFNRLCMDYKLLLIFHTADYQTSWPRQDQGPRAHFLEILISRYQRSPSFLLPTNRIINHHFHHDQKCPDITDHQPSGKRVSLPPATVGLDQKSSPVYSWSILPSTSFARFYAVSILSVPTKKCMFVFTKTTPFWTPTHPLVGINPKKTFSLTLQINGPGDLGIICHASSAALMSTYDVRCSPSPSMIQSSTWSSASTYDVEQPPVIRDDTLGKSRHATIHNPNPTILNSRHQQPNGFFYLNFLWL